ncbi:MAG TPA: C39 family peptidase [Patescibacteria group bacterium]|nr:C39 family peptidase [Patescibacteria group bacterium]
MKKLIFYLFSLTFFLINTPLSFASSFSDSFTNTNGTELPIHNSIWECFINPASIINNSVLSQNGDSYCFSNNLWTNGYAQITGEVLSANSHLRVIVRNNNYPNQYICEVTPSGANILKGADHLASTQTITSIGVHTLKCEVTGNTIKAFLDGNQILQATNTSLSSGSAGFYLHPHNVIYDDWESVDFDAAPEESTPSASLDVPLFKQGILPFTDNDPVWENQEFDHANAGQFYCGKILAECGCATTSVAMLLNYFGVTKLPDGETLGPGTLDSWLKNNNGYNRNLGIIWAVAATIAHKAKAHNPSFQYDALEVDDDWTFTDEKLMTDLGEKIPNVLQENTTLGTHFVVAKGIDTDNTFLINDPYYNYTNLASYSNTAASVRRFIPSHSDMSYISLSVDNGVTVTLKDYNGDPVGKIYEDFGPGNPTGDESKPQPIPLTIIEYAKPESGNYTIEVNSDNPQDFHLDITMITEEGETQTETLTGIVGPNQPELFTLIFDKQSTTESDIQKTVTFKSTLEDIKELRRTDLLSFITEFTITPLIKKAEYFHNKEERRSQKNNNKQAKQLLDVAAFLILKSPKHFVDPLAKEILLYDINQLKKLLTD